MPRATACSCGTEVRRACTYSDVSYRAATDRDLSNIVRFYVLDPLYPQA